ncbi:hypothetical protein CGLO_11912 [Colletotrichum gloeosporioides Cg-14]|uniref:Uncharacterized protein n=1 Tax=Colletotrichum gloeosporioides (strain Cg-14) TaxID=1237896 RepID=T0K9Z5_COLGC|nr:hypothetical protein CGLO_11912 [Colletotrichum gloeosporioides Cg-14]
MTKITIPTALAAKFFDISLKRSLTHLAKKT